MYNVGLALMRLEYVSDPKVGEAGTAPMIAENGMRVKAFAPGWWPHAVSAGEGEQ